MNPDDLVKGELYRAVGRRVGTWRNELFLYLGERVTFPFDHRQVMYRFLIKGEQRLLGQTWLKHFKELK